VLLHRGRDTRVSGGLVLRQPAIDPTTIRTPTRRYPRPV